MGAETEIVALTPELHRRLAANARDDAVMAFGADHAAEARHCNEWGYAVLRDGEPVLAAGLVPYWFGHAEGWLIAARSCGAWRFTAALDAARLRLDDWQRLPQFRRLQIFIRAGAPWRDLCVQKLGFRFEGTHVAWGPDSQDYECWARIAPETVVR